jgi:GNAT superfamily N-acetyltransferase
LGQRADARADEEGVMEKPDEVLFRRAGLADAQAVARLHADSWRRHYRGAYSDAFLDGDVEQDRIEVWTERLSGYSDGTATILAEDGDRVVGFANVVFDDEDGYGPLIDNLHVVFDRKRGGLGTRLLSHVAVAALGCGARGLHLWVLEQNTAAQAFYSARGGRCTGRRPARPPGGVPGRLNGSPTTLRYAWADPALLIV